MKGHVAFAGLCLLAACSTTPTFVDDPDGGAGGAATSTVTGTGTATGTSAGGACSVPSDCPGQEDACAFRTCVDGVCGQGVQPDGFALSVQIAGDCQRQLCDGRGGLVMVPYPDDVPVDGDPCTDDLCSGAVPSNPQARPGKSCGPTASVACNSEGKCTGCSTSADCTAPTPCTTYSCGPTGVCDFTNVAPGGGNLEAQVPGDCALKVCNGEGAIASIADDTDKPVDGNSCTEDECVAGSAKNPPKADGTPCQGDIGGSGGQCSDGECAP